MQLLELACGEFTDEDVIRQLADFCDRKLGKGVVHCADTPGFLGNRVGVYAIQCALHGAFKLGLQPLQADALFGRPMGISKLVKDMPNAAPKWMKLNTILHYY